MSETDIITDSEQIEAKKRELEGIVTRARKLKRGLFVAGIVYRVLFFAVIFIMMAGAFTVGMSAEDKAVLDAMPGFFYKILSFCGKIVDAVAGFAVKLMPQAVPVWVTYVLCGVIAVFLPALIALAARKIAGATSGDFKFPENADIKTCFETTYESLFRRYVSDTMFPIALMLALAGAAALVVAFLEDPEGRNGIGWIIFSGIVTLAVLYGVIMLLAAITRNIALGARRANRALPYSFDLEKDWANYDPEKKAELEERARKEAEARRARERERERQAASTSVQSSRMAHVTFDATDASSANYITVYVDGQKKCELTGGRSRTVDLTAGRHTISATVYNDASERAYSLDPATYTLEAGEDYTVDYS